MIPIPFKKIGFLDLKLVKFSAFIKIQIPPIMKSKEPINNKKDFFLLEYISNLSMLFLIREISGKKEATDSNLLLHHSQSYQPKHQI